MQNEFEKIEKVRVPALDEILGKKFPVLDDGFVRVIDYMGSDESIVQAARVSYGKGTKKVSEDRGLIRYLMRNRHTTPFEMCEIKFHIRVPMDTWRQWIRHRTANVNEYSTRYSIAIDASQKTAPNQWRLQAKDNKQGSNGFLDESIGKKLSEREEELQNFAREIYRERLEFGVAREQARKDLPLSTYTEAYWKIDLHNLLHFLSLRMDSHAQYEIRSYANVIGNEIVAKWCPLTWEAFLDYQINSITFSSIEIKIINALIRNNTDEAIKIAEELGWLNKIENRFVRNRERIEFEEKITRLGLEKPW
ncbi:MAG: FAD-dependent thymidylate synthase [Melioribacter sp.]|uniref:FAD-dependent thymidylate synthase n=1 Tax=Rosettibacter primus TaxID=3111523 RepID=UPI00247D4EB0|nr:FAD-dependent thymidylate synthase [Melioribacter sp.]